MYITLKSIDLESATVILHNDTDKQIYYGYSYKVEKKDGNEWKRVTSEKYSVLLIATSLNANSTTEIKCNLTYFDLSKAGTYRLVYDNFTYAEFRIERDGEPPLPIASLITDTGLSLFSECLDNEKFTDGLYQSEFIDQMEKYFGENQAILFYDSEYGGGCQGNDREYSFGNDFYDDGTNIKYSSHMETTKEPNGLVLPRGIKFGDSLKEVFEKLYIGYDPHSLGEYSYTHNDSFQGTMLYNDYAISFVFKNYAMSKAPVEFEFPYELVFTEKYYVSRSDGRQSEVNRTMSLSFDAADHSLGKISMRVTESYASLENT